MRETLPLNTASVYCWSASPAELSGTCVQLSEPVSVLQVFVYSWVNLPVCYRSASPIEQSNTYLQLSQLVSVLQVSLRDRAIRYLFTDEQSEAIRDIKIKEFLFFPSTRLGIGISAYLY